MVETETLSSTRRSMLATALVLEQARSQLDTLADALPDPLPAMVNGEQRLDLSATMLGALELVSKDYLGPAVRTLHLAASMTEEQLELAWQERHATTEV